MMNRRLPEFFKGREGSKAGFVLLSLVMVLCDCHMGGIFAVFAGLARNLSGAGENSFSRQARKDSQSIFPT